MRKEYKLKFGTHYQLLKKAKPLVFLSTGSYFRLGTDGDYRIAYVKVALIRGQAFSREFTYVRVI